MKCTAISTYRSTASSAMTCGCDQVMARVAENAAQPHRDSTLLHARRASSHRSLGCKGVQGITSGKERKRGELESCPVEYTGILIRTRGGEDERRVVSLEVVRLAVCPPRQVSLGRIRSKMNALVAEKPSKLGVARVLLVPPRDGLAQRDILDELLARQLRVGARVRLLRPQPGRDGLPLVGLASAGGDLDESVTVSLNGFVHVTV